MGMKYIMFICCTEKKNINKRNCEHFQLIFNKINQPIRKKRRGKIMQ